MRGHYLNLSIIPLRWDYFCKALTCRIFKRDTLGPVSCRPGRSCYVSSICHVSSPGTTATPDRKKNTAPEGPSMTSKKTPGKKIWLRTGKYCV